MVLEPGNLSNRPGLRVLRIQNPPPIPHTASTGRPLVYSPHLTPTLRPCIPIVSHEITFACGSPSYLISADDMPVSQRRTSTAFLTSCQMHGPNWRTRATAQASWCGMYTAIKRSVQESLCHTCPFLLYCIFCRKPSWFVFMLNSLKLPLRPPCVAPSAQCRMETEHSRNGGSSEGAARLAPDLSKRKPRQPYTPEFIAKVGGKARPQSSPWRISVHLPHWQFLQCSRVGKSQLRATCLLKHSLRIMGFIRWGWKTPTILVVRNCCAAPRTVIADTGYTVETVNGGRCTLMRQGKIEV